MATLCSDAMGRHQVISWPVRMLLGFAATAALVTVVYFFIDQPVISFFRSCGLDRYRFLKWLTRPPELFVLFSPVVLLVGLLRRWYAPWTWAEKAAVAAAVSTLFAALATLLLKMTFGRSADGFHPFHVGSAYWAFPSGHTACTLAVTVVARDAFPRWRLCCWSIDGIVATMLILLSHHFVGDILGGAFLGWAVGGTAARWFGIEKPSISESVVCTRSPRRAEKPILSGSPVTILVN